MQHFDDIFFLIATYAIAYGLGVFISKLWLWLRVLFFIVIFYGYFGLLDIQEFKLSVFLVFVVPVCLFLYPSLKKMLSLKFGTLNPILWLYHKIREGQRLKRYKQEEAAREAHAQREAKLQAEQARQKAEQEAQTEKEARERAEEARRKAEREAQTEKEARSRAEEARRKAEQRERSKLKTDAPKDPYDILGVSKQDALETIEKAYKALAKKYHPNAVHHLGEEFREMAHEKFIAIEQAWSKIKEKF